MKYNGVNRVFTIAALALFCAGVGRAQSFSAQAQVDRNDVFVGESFQLQIHVTGSENPEKPDLERLDGFSVRFLGGQQNSSQLISIVNGKITRDVRKGYVFVYELTPAQAGTLTIPAITVRGESKVAQTQPRSIVVQRPAETDDFHLRLRLSKEQCYVGEPITLTVTWYLGQDVRGFGMTVPLLENPAVFHANPDIDTSVGGPYVRIPLAGGEAIGVQGRGQLDGKEYATVTVEQMLIPKEPGAIAVEPAVVTCEALMGYRDRQRRPGGAFDDDFMSSFFQDGFFGQRREGVYRRVSAPSNRLTLHVLPLPAAGRPAGFAGHVGEYRIETAATPLEVGVGDPITLNVVISGPPYLAHVLPPALDRQGDLVRDFRIPAEMAAGKATPGGKLFTQTLRALRPDVKRIPPIELPYFDAAAGEYRVARSAPIPLTVKAARVVTAEDAEGRDPAGVSQRSLEGWTAGIAHNYEDAGLLRNRRSDPDAWLESPLRMAGLAVPPAAYLVALLTVWTIRRRSADPQAVRSRGAMRAFARSLKAATGATAGQVVMDSLRIYLGDKLGMVPGALTFNDAQPRLCEKGVDRRTLEELSAVFRECEAGRYAGAAQGMSPDELRHRALSVARCVEKTLSGRSAKWSRG